MSDAYENIFGGMVRPGEGAQGPAGASIFGNPVASSDNTVKMVSTNPDAPGPTRGPAPEVPTGGRFHRVHKPGRFTVVPGPGGHPRTVMRPAQPGPISHFPTGPATSMSQPNVGSSIFGGSTPFGDPGGMGQPIMEASAGFGGREVGGGPSRVWRDYAGLGAVVKSYGTPGAPPPPPKSQAELEAGWAAKQAAYARVREQAAKNDAAAGDNTMLYVGVGVGVLALGGLAYYMSKKKKSGGAFAPATA
jgi:hypothetical protein